MKGRRFKSVEDMLNFKRGARKGSKKSPWRNMRVKQTRKSRRK